MIGKMAVSPENLLEHRVGEHLQVWSKEILSKSFKDETIEIPIGKLLRTNLTWCLMSTERKNDSEFIEKVSYLCSAIELSHLASLFHDDVIDNGLIRRGLPSLWKKVGKGSSILAGDIFLCEAVSMVLKSGFEELLPIFISVIKETCNTEIEHEILSNSPEILNRNDYLRIARGKTGPLFSFAALSATYDPKIDIENSNVEVGYLIGTAYQLVDDYIDLWGSEQKSGKTLGTDLKRNKLTYPQQNLNSPDATLKEVDSLIMKALSLIKDENCRKETEKYVLEKIMINTHSILKITNSSS